MEGRVEEISKLLESAMRLSCTVKKGILFNKTSALVKFSTDEPYQSQGRDFFKLYGFNSLLPLTQANSEYYSPSRHHKILIRGEKEEEQYIEVWDQHRLRLVKELKKVHSTIIENPVFGEISWSSDERYIVYIAEASKKKSGSFWSGEEDVGNTNLYKENFGELLFNVTNPKLYVFDIKENSISEIPLPEDIYPAQSMFRPNSYDLVIVGYKKTSYKVGMTAMLNRESNLYQININNKEVIKIDTKDTLQGIAIPRFNPSGTLLAYYGVPKGKRSHVTCLSLNLLDWENKLHRCLVDAVEDYNDHFNGIYGFYDSLSTLSWLNEDKLIFETHHKGSNCIFTADLNGNVSEFTYDLLKPYHLSLLDVQQDTALIRAANGLDFHRILIANHTNGIWSNTLIDNLTPTPTTPEEEKIIDALNSTTMTTIKHQNTEMSSFLYHTSPGNPLFIIPHGGPHNQGVVDFTWQLGARLALGYNVLMTNFRGSTGYGNKNLEALLGNAGVVDVEDCLESLELAKQHVDTNYVISYGRSFGGFLSAHLASTGVPKLSIVVNGVTDISSMSLVTDITDWCFAEVFNEDPIFPPSEAQIAGMYRASPVARAGNINVPVLIITGGSDKRVPPHSSMELYRVLKGRGIDVKLLWYDKEGHGLFGKATTYDYTANHFIWVEEKMKG
ncbi:unnamed protein product [Blepharisma stoltei]|uniref:acylaminoacyl-peptidase n=1 Tax=Blepharisma stoltei TaxID=1481888 RepID=A0AAU9JWR9_9CILI|nr:unnamed protein product [Blepharisma stoltei]